MKKDNILPYIYDFVRILESKVENNVKDIILFGSVARGDFGKESDVDIFVNVSENNAEIIQKAVNDAENEFEIYSKRTWNLQGITYPIKCVVGNINSEQWSALKREIISSGISLYGRYKELPKELKHYFLFSFNLAEIKPKNKIPVIRQIYGYTTKKEKKIYKRAGLLDEIEGEKLNPGVVLVPAEKHKIIYDFFKKNRVAFRMREAWME